ncbi:zinc-dependent metalloprotease [Agriterribacter sp.]|uniref:zinc-dependent metalloprotease n=1 Tax=Agriterribacter sp. TaxID=2821509 RepID=UPI002B618BDA|nr:zinc-dependent metalloprotease [Agriterribacter sp.]HTN07627.1 zinc-dependent metalloprotease [Agriterribacter sp.]
MKGVIAAFCCVLLSSAQILAQPVCGFDQSNYALQQANPSYKLRVSLNEQQIEQFIQKRKAERDYQKKETGIFTIPIVVHVLHTGEPVGTPFNPADEQILAAIDYLNAIYSGIHVSLTPAGTDAAADLGLRFVLAKRDPDCNPTTGIQRVNMSSNAAYTANGASSGNITQDIDMKAPVAWDRSKYYNIYVVNKINGQNGTTGQFIAGYAYFPTSSVVDGTVMLATQMKPGSKTLSHEMGHAFNLYHTFEGSANRDKCPIGKGDHVDDTDPVSFNANASGAVDFTCRTGNNACINQPYSIRTESNFMSYTNCYTLFTPGQRDRIQASILLEERSSLIISAGAVSTYASPSCTPKINFEQQSAELAKTATTVSGCLKYRDHVFKLTIGGDPLQNATAVLAVDPASTAMEHGDFDFPSGKNIIFPAGSNSSRPFILRIYDNGSSAETKLLRLNFSVNNGGGIAEIGTAAPVMDINIQPGDYSPVIAGGAAIATVGSSAYHINNAKIFNAALRKQKTQILYKSGELSAAGLSAGSFITGIRFFVEKNTVRAFKNLSIKMAQTTLANLAENGSIRYAGNMTTVLSLASYATVNGWNIFTLTQPFSWDGAGNIAVELCFDNGTAAAGAADIVHAYSDESDGEQGSMIEDETVNCSENFALVSFYRNGVKPVVMLDYTIQGNPVDNSIAESKEEYLGPYNEVYFYDKLQPQKIMAKIKNLGAWDYGCTTVSIDREGDGVAPFWNSVPAQYLTRKTFFVMPQNNNASGSYEITLYYTDAEKLGYERATGKNWADVKVIKTQIPVSFVTPATPEADKVEINAVVAHGSFGEDHMVQAAFNTGFSGFSIGALDAVLPVSWLNFEAINRDGGVKLRWLTAMEFNNSHFEVQASSDGTNYSMIGTLPSKKGNSNTATAYEYFDLQPRAGKMYYRIKQVDQDGKSAYSKIIAVYITGNSNQAPSLYPVPAGNNITVHFGKPAANASVEILSSDMKCVYTGKINGTVLTQTIYTGNWAAGTYIVRLTAGKSSYILRFVKL